KFDLSILIVQNFRKGRVDEIKLCGVQPKRDGKLQFLRSSRSDEQFLQFTIMSEIGWVPIDRLLEIAHHAEMTRSGSDWAGWIFEPGAAGFQGSRDFQEHKKLLRIGVLRFVEDNSIVFFANALGYIRKPHQFSCQRNLIGVRDETSLEAKLAIIALH